MSNGRLDSQIFSPSAGTQEIDLLPTPARTDATRVQIPDLDDKERKPPFPSGGLGNDPAFKTAAKVVQGLISGHAQGREQRALLRGMDNIPGPFVPSQPARQRLKESGRISEEKFEEKFSPLAEPTRRRLAAEEAAKASLSSQFTLSRESSRGSSE